MILDDFKEILERFPIESKKPIKNNELANKMRNEFRMDFEDFVLDLTFDKSKYSVKISPGMGTWVSRPWAGIKNSDATTTFQEGLYLIYIFNIDKNGFYLSLDQGNYNTPDNIRKDIADYLINIFLKSDFSIPSGFVFDETKLHPDTILSKFYNIEDVTIYELENDLKLLIEIYEYLISFYNIYVEENDIKPSDTSDSGIGDGDVKTTNYWLISAGSGAKWWDEFYKDNVVGMGMSGTGDLNKYKNKNEIKLRLQEIYNDNSSHVNDVHACWQFVHEMKIGDVIFVKKGMDEIIGAGVVESDYEYDTTKSFHNIRKVKWTHNGSWLYENTRTFPYKTSKLPMKTLTDITNYTEMVNYIEELIDNGGGGSTQPVRPYSIEKFLDEVYITEENYNTLEYLLMHKKNLIVQGPPGVGKTFMAKRLAYSMMGQKDINRVMMVQFHQSYSYEDFVMGYRPSNEGFELRQGSFYQFCKKAEEDSENDYFFIIDEINRGNLSKIFGELFMLIEADKRGDRNKIQLLYSDEKFFIPKNLYIIGLMNTADRSLAMIDYALRRRFAFFDLKPGFDSAGFRDYCDELSNSNFDNLVLTLKELNEEIKNDESLGDGFRIGHSYLCNLKSADNLDFIVEYELIPLLKEYWFDEQDKVKIWSDKLRSVIND